MDNWNKTSKFLLPCILVNSNLKEFPLSTLKTSGFVNAYINDYGLRNSSFAWYESDEYFLYTLFKPKSLKTFSVEEEVYKRFSNWVDYYDLPDGHVMHVFKLKDKYRGDYEKFIRGEYSKFSKGLKERYSNTLAEGIVNKTEYAREQMSKLYEYPIPEEQEYMSIPTLSQEIYRCNS
jgi:hypothetical protein